MSRAYRPNKNMETQTGQTPEVQPTPVGVGSGTLVRPPGFPPSVWVALQEVRHAQKRLEDDYPRWNEAGKKHAVESAAAALRRAHVELTSYVAEVARLTA